MDGGGYEGFDDDRGTGSIDRLSGVKLAFVCGRCPWWTTVHTAAKKSAKGHLQCGNCGAMLRVLPLEPLVISTQENAPQHVGGFIGAFSENWQSANAGVPILKEETK